MTQVAQQTQNAPAPISENTLENVLVKISNFVENGDLSLPDNYSPENAARSAWLMLQEQVDLNKRPVLEVCTKTSVANALLKMVVQGMNPMKGQCYFIPYGDKLTFQRSYAGSMALAKRVSPVKEIKANAIYQDDVFKYEIDANTGRRKLISHDQDFENIDHEKVKGAYALITFEDGTTDLEPMTMKQIRSAWNQGQMKGNSGAHKNFTDEMACKTVINRACKLWINSSDDSDLMKEDEQAIDQNEASVKTEIAGKANKKTLTFDEAEVVGTTVNKAPEAPAAADANGQTAATGPGF